MGASVTPPRGQTRRKLNSIGGSRGMRERTGNETLKFPLITHRIEDECGRWKVAKKQTYTYSQDSFMLHVSLAENQLAMKEACAQALNTVRSRRRIGDEDAKAFTTGAFINDTYGKAIGYSVGELIMLIARPHTIESRVGTFIGSAIAMIRSARGCMHPHL